MLATAMRKKFLDEKWDKYPVMPSHHTCRGRIYEIEDKFILLESSNQMKYVMPHKWQGILRPGDLISFSHNNSEIQELLLLSPYLHDVNNKDSYDFSLRIQQQKNWNQFIFLVREFFNEKKFIEIQTPTLVECPGTEPTLDVFQTELRWGAQKKTLFLPTSPELHLKKAVCQGFEKVFEIRPCFRNNEKSETHLNEFWMIEWYRSFAPLSEIKQDIKNLIFYLCEKLELNKPEKFDEFTMQDLFLSKMNFNLTPQTTAQELKQLCHSLEIQSQGFEDFDDLFFLLYLEKIERQLPFKPIYIENYPPSQAALARLTKNGWGERFEFYWHGLEIANAFHELNDPAIQQQRFAEDIQKKIKYGKQVVPIDQEFMQSLNSGMPPTSGIALGLDRLFMALYGIKNITEIRVF